ncbi:pyridoxamine 5'-phosphate oxidase, partial [Flavobacteriaceae bacterium]|nr:pyridoxamine 5'-phosphate oxidase [Flavobacteriaceae bacterium]
MTENLQDYRQNYEKGKLSKSSVDTNPLKQFQTWFSDIKKSKSVQEVNAMTLTTLGLDGFPKGRIVLLKKYDEYGFYFYTNYLSEKGKSIMHNEKVSLSFFWPSLERQIIIKGIATKTSKEDSENYFNSRPNGSKLGAIVSSQSDVIENRKILEKKLNLLELEYAEKEIEKPAYWGGFLVAPISIEFWQGRPNRL